MAAGHPGARERGVVDDADLVVAVEDLGDRLLGNLLAGQCLGQLRAGAWARGQQPEADLAGSFRRALPGPGRPRLVGGKAARRASPATGRNVAAFRVVAVGLAGRMLI